MKLFFIYLSILIISIDQFSKIYIKTHFTLYEELNIFHHIISIFFIENPGIACFNFLFLDFYSKCILSILRLIVVVCLVYKFIVTKNTNICLLLSKSLLTAGALSNLLDNIFYGVIFDKGIKYNFFLNKWIDYQGLAKISLHNLSGYSHFMFGSVVDIISFSFKFNIFDHVINYHFIFNIADLSIFIGLLLYTYTKYFNI